MEGQIRLAPKSNHGGPRSAGRQLHFDVSTGLKRVIGRDLITDDEVAVFELVKNSFDAGAGIVQIRFEGDSIWLADDGDGMTLEDLTSKWLFVAYSAKREAASETFRQQIAERRNFAGSKESGDSRRTDLAVTLSCKPGLVRTRPAQCIKSRSTGSRLKRTKPSALERYPSTTQPERI